MDERKFTGLECKHCGNERFLVGYDEIEMEHISIRLVCSYCGEEILLTSRIVVETKKKEEKRKEERSCKTCKFKEERIESEACSTCGKDFKSWEARE